MNKCLFACYYFALVCKRVGPVALNKQTSQQIIFVKHCQKLVIGNTHIKQYSVIGGLIVEKSICLFFVVVYLFVCLFV